MVRTSRYLLLRLLPLVALLMAACEKEIDLDYRTVEPLYVVEASLHQDGARVRITTTRDIKQQSRDGIYVNDATVVLIDADGFTDTLRFEGKGVYTSPWGGIEGLAYTADVTIDGHHYTSTSTMQPMPQVASFRFVWKKVLSQRILFADLRLNDLPDRRNYYFLHLYKNGVGYRWAVIDDTMNPGGELQQLFSCMTKDEMEKGTSKDVIKEGDALRLEIRAIDRRAYDYLYAVQLIDDTNTNPTPNFTGGCLGYFSAYSYVEINHTFTLEGIEVE